MTSIEMRRPRLERQMAVDTMEDPSAMRGPPQRNYPPAHQQNAYPQQQIHQPPQRQDTVIHIDSIHLIPK